MGKKQNGKELKKIKLDVVNIKEFNGDFYSDELSTKYNLSIVDGN
jgi:hypothetical protein